jgi:hypothetical protein
MRMAVPELRRVDPLPRALDELVLGEPAGQARAARVPQALLGPQIPRGKRGETGGGAGAVQKSSSAQAGQFLM